MAQVRSQRTMLSRSLDKKQNNFKDITIIYQWKIRKSKLKIRLKLFKDKNLQKMLRMTNCLKL